MTNRDSVQQMAINRAKSRALERLRKENPETYEKYYEEEMLVDGYQRVPRGPHDRGGKGPFVWNK